MGWYRVQSDSTITDVAPSEADLRMNGNEILEICRGANNRGPGDGDESSARPAEDDVEETPLFVLMNAATPERKASAEGATSEEQMDENEELPLTIYESLEVGGGAGGPSSSVFVNADFELETHEPERIAVEKVFRTQPSQTAARASAEAARKAEGEGKEGEPAEAAAGEGNSPMRKGKKKKKEGDESKGKSRPSGPAFTRPTATELDTSLDSLRSSVASMNVRISVLVEWLRKVQRGDLPPDPSLLRTVDGLVRQLPLVAAALREGKSSPYDHVGGASRRPLREMDNDLDGTMILTYLAAVAKAARDVNCYSEKFRCATESGKLRY